MKPPRPTKSIGRKRRAAAWTLLTLALLVAIAWIASTQRFFTWSNSPKTVSLGCGILQFFEFSFERASGYASAPISPGVRRIYWLLDDAVQGRKWHAWIISYAEPAAWTRYRVLSIALWPIPILLTIPAALLLRSSTLARRRVTQGMCAQCGYSLAGLAPNTPCPECGSQSSAAVQRDRPSPTS